MKTERTNCLLTIAIPTYNRRNLLKRALDSIVPQLNPKIEVLVSDNASDDGTEEMLAESYPMIRYTKNETNMGWDYNFLQCYRKAKGKYVMLLGSDDRFADRGGVLDYLTDFLEKNDCDLIFLNYDRFDVTQKEVSIKDSEWIKDYKDKQDIVTADRDCFMKYADHAITFMSAMVVKTSLVTAVKEPERFFGTNFAHTCIMLEAVKGKEALFGIIMQPMVEQNVTAGDAVLSKTPEKTLSVYGKDMYSVLCEHAVECGFRKGQMKQVYLHRLEDCPFWRTILSYRRQNHRLNRKSFWKGCYPAVKPYPAECIKTVAAALAPQCIVDMAYRVHNTLKRANSRP